MGWSSKTIHTAECSDINCKRTIDVSCEQEVPDQWKFLTLSDRITDEFERFAPTHTALICTDCYDKLRAIIRLGIC